MADEERGESRGFKVVDRRRFDEDGALREGAELAPEPPKKPAAPPPSASAPPPPASRGADEEMAGEEGGAEADPHFLAFMQGLAQQAVMHMGLMPYPSGRRDLQLEAARDTIDILVMLKRKTVGNLSAEEKHLLDGLIGELKMTFLEVAEKVAAATEGRGPGGGMPKL